MKNHRVKLLIAASLVLLLGLAAAIGFGLLDRGPTLSESELEAIARDWAADSMDGAAGDEFVEFIVANTTVNSPDSLRMYLKEHMDSGATWTYGPFEKADRDSNEASATVALQLEDIMPMTTAISQDDMDRIRALGLSLSTMPAEPGDFRNAFTLTFRLTVDPASKSVTDWRVEDGEAVYVHIPPAA